MLSRGIAALAGVGYGNRENRTARGRLGQCHGQSPASTAESQVIQVLFSAEHLIANQLFPWKLRVYLWLYSSSHCRLIADLVVGTLALLTAALLAYMVTHLKES